VIDQWDRYDATLAAYRRALAGTGHKGRSADQFGTLLAFADLLLYDGPEPEPEVLNDWAEALRATDLAETADNRSDAEDACEFLAGPCCSCAAATSPSRSRAGSRRRSAATAPRRSIWSRRAGASKTTG
jgi:hypothetical protein